MPWRSHRTDGGLRRATRGRSTSAKSVCSSCGMATVSARSWVSGTTRASRHFRRLPAGGRDRPDGRSGIWDRESGRLIAVLDAPQGEWTDNAAIAISPDNRLIAFSSHRQARLWEIETGKLLGSWKLATGIQDNLAFQGNDRLLLARVETTDPTWLLTVARTRSGILASAQSMTC